MEVHAHTHTPRKRWSHYFWEFLMLFLAVFCGFLAEYKLEHTIEHQREKQFMKSLAEDLEKDITALENESRLIQIQFSNLDSLTSIIYKGTLSNVDVIKMYELQRKSLYPLSLRLINRTEMQLKNAGGMRLIRNKNVADSIINYWSLTELFYETKESINAHRIRAKDLSFSLFNNKFYNHEDDFSLDFPLNPEMGEPELMTRDPNKLAEFANRVSHMSDLLKFNYKLRRVNRLRENASRLTQLIRKEYHLN